MIKLGLNGRLGPTKKMWGLATAVVEAKNVKSLLVPDKVWDNNSAPTDSTPNTQGVKIIK